MGETTLNSIMGIIHFHSPLLPIFSHFKHKQLKSTKPLWLPSNEPTELLRRQNIPSLLPLRTQAITTSSLVVGINSSPPASVDFSVFIETSVLLLLVYWIANFVVPDMISKNLPSKKPREDQMTDDIYFSKDEKENIHSSSNTSEETGFQ